MFIAQVGNPHTVIYSTIFSGSLYVYPYGPLEAAALAIGSLRTPAHLFSNDTFLAAGYLEWDFSSTVYRHRLSLVMRTGDP